MTLNTSITKSYIEISFYCVKEAIASKIINYFFITLEINLEDILQKYWWYYQVHVILKYLLF